MTKERHDKKKTYNPFKLFGSYLFFVIGIIFAYIVNTNDYIGLFLYALGGFAFGYLVHVLIRAIKFWRFLIVLACLTLIAIIVVLLSQSGNIEQYCDPGQSQCIGDVVETCTVTGSSFVQTEICTECDNGQCVEDCQPHTCSYYGKNCGYIDNGCGQTINCGSCSSNQVCSDNKCQNTCKPYTCSYLGRVCGTTNGGCGGTINCGTCSIGYTCSTNGRCVTSTSLPKFSDSYETARKAAGISDEYLKETWYYDYSNIYKGAEYNEFLTAIKKQDPLVASKAIAEIVYESIDYDLAVATLNYCYNNKASDILRNQVGVCSTMSRVDIAMLRGIGLAAREVTGCAKWSGSCKYIMTFLQERPFEETFIEEDGKYVVAGGLHSWVEVWLPNRGWTIIEATNGHIYPSNCIEYDSYGKEPFSTNSVDECSMSSTLANKCKAW